MFTFYIVIILNFSSFIPCSCGGILEKLGWREHLIFNIFFLFLALAAAVLFYGKRQALIHGLTMAAGGALIVGILFVFSEDIMERENPFIRRFPQYAAVKSGKLDLKNHNYYIAGTYGKKIYLGNRMSPLQILETNSQFTYKINHSILLDREDFKFKVVEVKVNGSDFYVTDGTVPVIYRGSISDWKAKVFKEKKFYFSDLVILKDGSFVFRTQLARNGENILGATRQDGDGKTTFYPQILQKQKDGIFDTDGTLQYSKEQDRILFTYYYRNQYIVADKDLAVLYSGNTIDTTTTAKLKVVKLKQSGDTKLGAPAYVVNRHTTVYGNLLFVNSLLRGRYEDKEVWKHSAVVDIYDISKKAYVFSFYVLDEESSRMKSFYAAESAIYAVSGHYLLKYSYGKKLIAKIRKEK
jgi:hypothetical protein